MRFTFGRRGKIKQQDIIQPVEKCIQKKEEKIADGNLAVLPENKCDEFALLNSSQKTNMNLGSLQRIGIKLDIRSPDLCGLSLSC